MANPSIRFRKVRSYPTSGVNVGDVIFCIEDRTVYVATGSTTKEAFYGGNVKNVTTVEDSDGGITGLQITYMDGTDALTVDFFASKTALEALQAEMRSKLNKVESGSGAVSVTNSTTGSNGTITHVARVSLKIDSTDPGNVTLSQSDNGLKASVDLSESADYTIEALDTAETGYLKSYQLMKDGVAVGAKINIPKDFLVQGGYIETGTWNGNTFTASASGTGKALKLVLMTKDGSASGSAVYINVKDLVDVYTAGDGIAVSSDNKISIDANNAAAYIMVPDPDDNSGDTTLSEAIIAIREHAMGDGVKAVNGKTGYIVLNGYENADTYKQVTFVSNTDGSLGAYVAGLGTAATKSADDFALVEYVDNKFTWYSFDY